MTTFAVKTLEPQPAAVLRGEAPIEELPAVFDRGFHEVMQAIEAQGVTVTGPPFGFYPRMPGETVEVAVGFPTTVPVNPHGEVRAFELPGGRAITGVHVGPYDTLERTYGELTVWAAAERLQLAPYMWESYLTDPSAEPDPNNWQTLIIWPVT
jgi:effector-binding domain-containing protein